MTHVPHTLGGAVRSLSILVLALAAVLLGCDDPYGPQPWSAFPDTVTLYAADHPEYQGRASAFDFVNPRAVAIESPGEAMNWDMALVTGDRTLQLAPPSSFRGLSSIASIAVETEPFDEVERAPSDTARYARTESVPLEPANVYVIRSRRFFDAIGRSCSMYIKVQPLVIDEERGRFEFTYVRNPNCNDRSLVPTED